MRSIVRRAAFAFAAIGLVALGGCSKSDPAPSGCTRAPVPSTGPGDTFNYFPAAVGWSWTYQILETSGTATMNVTGTAPVGSETAYVFMSYADTTTTELVVKRPAGVYVLADPSEGPPFDQLYPSLILPFPVEVKPAAEQVRCSNLDLGQDLDGDGKPEHADMNMTLAVLSVSEIVQVPAGSFTDVAHVQTVAHVTVRGTKGLSVTVDATQDEWLARDVGRVRSMMVLSSPAIPPEQRTMALQSFTASGAAALTPSFAPLAAEPAVPAAPRTLEEAAAQLARWGVGARR